MTEPTVLVLDNSVLSSFDEAGWFDSLRSWDEKHDVVTSRRMWEEFSQIRERNEPPNWSSVREGDLERIQAPAIGQLSRQDWSGVAVIEGASGGVLATNDRALFKVVEERGHEARWGTSLAIQTFKSCDISVQSFEDGTEPYLNDVYLPTEVADTVRESEKPRPE